MLLGATGKAVFQKEKANETGFSLYFKNNTAQGPPPFQHMSSLSGCDTAASYDHHAQLKGMDKGEG